MSMLFKCKICGGSLSIQDNDTIAVCEYCGTKQTLPKLDSEKKASLLDRADYFRRSNEYDKAMSIYEQILADEKSDAEIYWLIVLCRYGIEYVEDPTSHNRIPTVNRVQYNSILNDSDYLKAIELADYNQKELYIEEANKINDIQKGILEISNREEPFDIFICYKETDDLGRRTEDSVIAQDIYKELTNEGYKVFFSRITLEDKIGTAYEPYIFAALNSAKVMLVIGTKKEYFNAVWVKNEWSRYLSLIQKGEKKILVPCYKNMNPYDLPEEFAYLQAQDLNKLGYIQDLLRGIEKIAPKQKVVNINTSTQTVSTQTSLSSLLQRAQMYLEDGTFDSADDYAEKVLDVEPTNADAYLVKLLATHEAKTIDNLKHTGKSFEDDSSFTRYLKYGNPDTINELKEILGYINTSYLYKEYLKYIEESDTYKSLSDLKITVSSAKGIFKDGEKEKLLSLIDNKLDSDDFKKQIYNNAIIIFNNAQTIEELENCKEVFKSFINYSNDKELLYECNKLINEIQNKENEIKYQEVVDALKKSKTINEYRKFISVLKSLDDYKDSKELIEKCNKQIELKQKRNTIIFSLFISVLVIIFVKNEVMPSYCYKKAIETYRNGEIISAYNQFFKNKDYKLSEVYMKVIMQNINEDNSDLYSSLNSKLITTQSNNTFTGFNDIVYTCEGSHHTVGLKSDGTVVATGSNDYGQCNVQDWTDIISISSGDYHTVGLKSDGTVVAVGVNHKGQCDVQDWTDIVAISSGYNHTVGLKSDGTVVATGSSEYGQCSVRYWTDIVAISSGFYHTVGLKSDGTVVATGAKDKGQCYIQGWTDIVTISAGSYHTVGLKSDGTVFATGNNGSGQCNVQDWTDIVAITSGFYHTVGLKSDGTVVAVGYNNNNQCNVQDWSLICDVFAVGNDTYAIKITE